MNQLLDDQDHTQLIGTVIAVQANFYSVRLENYLDSTGQIPILLCTRRSRLKKIGQQVMVGDRVLIEEPDWSGNRGAISQVFSRQSELDRPPMANADQILLVFAMAEPDLDITALSRFLVKAESTNLDVLLCLNKCDLVNDEELKKWRDRLFLWGYQPLFISVQTGSQNNNLANIGHSLNDIYSQLQKKITIVCGPSGVGKSSLINWLIPGLNLRIGEVSGKLARGRHTTRHVELFELPMGGLLADSPGFNQPDLECEPEALADLFPETREKLADASCQFSNCLHRDEPNCVVRGNWERYEIYLTFLGEAIARTASLQQQRHTESALKSKVKEGGKQHYEPKLQTKKYRRSSRRVEHQKLQDFESD